MNAYTSSTMRFCSASTSTWTQLLLRVTDDARAQLLCLLLAR